MDEQSKVDAAIAYLSSKISGRPEIAVVLGSGLGDFADQVSDPIVIATDTIPSYPLSSVHGHAGRLVFGRIHENGRQSPPLLVFKGRVHYYETGNLETSLFSIRVAKALGVRAMILTNAAGGINRAFSEGDLMLFDDFVNLTTLKAHRGENDDGPALFRTRNRPYLDKQLSLIIEEASVECGVDLRRGTYCWLKGPSYETKAEIEMLRRIGADAVGMSTVPEIILAAGLGIRTTAVSLISNMAAGITANPLSHAEVAETAGREKEKFIGLLKEAVLRIQN